MMPYLYRSFPAKEPYNWLRVGGKWLVLAFHCVSEFHFFTWFPEMGDSIGIYIYVCVHTYVCICTCTCVYVSIYIHVNIYICVPMCVYILIYINIYVCSHVFVHMYIYHFIYMYTHIYSSIYRCVCLCLCMYVCTHIHQCKVRPENSLRVVMAVHELVHELDTYINVQFVRRAHYFW